MRVRRVVTALVLLAAAAGVAWLASSRTDDPAAPPPTSAPAPSRDARPARVKPAEPAAVAATPPPPVDLEHADRDLDLFGVVVDAAGTPVANATLQCVTYPWKRILSRRLDWWKGAWTGASTRSAADGTFALRLRRGDSVTLRAAATGFATIERPHSRAGERIRIALAPGVTVRVRTADESGAAVAGTRLNLYGLHEVDFRREAVTDAAGLAAWTDVPANCPANLWVEPKELGGVIRGFATPESGETTVEVVLPKGRTITGHVTDADTGKPIAGARVGMFMRRFQSVLTGDDGAYALPGWTEKPSAYQIDVTATGYAREALMVASATTIDVALHAGVAATGRVVGASGTPIAGACVSATGWAFPASGEVYSHGDATTGDDGRFRIADLRTGLDHKLLVLADGFARALVVWDATKPDAGDVVLGPPRIVAGLVRDAAGAPVARAEVTLIASTHDEEWIGDPEEAGRTDDLGRFAFRDVAPGRYLVRTDPQGNRPVRVTVNVQEDRDVSDVVLTLAGGRRITVHVEDESGAPVARSGVSLVTANGSHGVRADERGTASVLVQDAAARIEVQPPFEDARDFLAPDPVDVPATGDDVRVVLLTAAHVTGTIVLADGKPPPRVWIDARVGAKRIARALNDVDGTFRLVVPATGLVSVVYGGPNGGSVENRPYWDLDARVDGVAPGATGVVLRLGPAVHDRTLVVRVLSPSGGPAAQATVFWHQDTPESSHSGSTGEDGRVTLRGLAARDVRVSVAPHNLHDWLSTKAATVLPDGQEIEFAYVEAIRIQGHVVNADGSCPAGRTPATWGRVIAFVGDREVASCGVADAGLFGVTIPATENGPFRLVAEGFGGKTGSLDSAAPGAKDLEIVVAPK